MRSFGLIFCFYLLLLAIYPGIVANFGSSKVLCHSAACAKTQPGKSEENKKDFPSNLRTPLFMCPQIQITTHQINEVNFGIDVSKIEFGSFEKQYRSINPVAPWHPPKFSLSA
jgi:hypothetical protein